MFGNTSLSGEAIAGMEQPDNINLITDTIDAK